MSAIECITAGVKDMADGSLRITLEFDPRYAKDAFSLFGARGTSCAVVALTQEAAKQSAQTETIEAGRQKGGALAKLAGIWSDDPIFWNWLNKIDTGLAFIVINDKYHAKNVICHWCEIESRAELDSNPEAAERFHKFIREPYSEYLRNI